MRVVDLVRHGDYGGPEKRLTERGVHQMEVLAQRYLREGVPTQMFVSPLARTQHCAEVMGPMLGLEGTTHNGLAEGLPSVPDPVPPRLVEYLDLYFTPKLVASAHKRMERMAHKLTRRRRGANRHTLVLCHGNTSRYLWTRAMGQDPKEWWSLYCPKHASMSRYYVMPNGEVRGASFNDCGHLPPELQSV